ncbi:RNA-dependent RNA polymerase, partial [Plantago enamovirus]
DARVPDAHERSRVIKLTAAEYEHTAQSSPDWIRNGFNEALARKFFLGCVSSLQMDSGPGVPYSSFMNWRSNLEWLDSSDKVDAMWELVLSRLRRMLNYEFSTPESAVLDGVTDPVRVFVKGEPHKLSKLAEGRYRLIASVSLVDQLVARMLFQSQNKTELSMYQTIPSQPGLGLSQDYQIAEFTSRLAKISGAPDAGALIRDWKEFCVPTDCSGFDWSVPLWLLEDDMEVRNLLTKALHPELRALRDMWLKCLTNSLFCLSDGTLLAQTTPGIQKSGSYNTSSSNSRMRVLMSKHA